MCVANWEQSEYDTLLFHDRIINFDRDKTTSFVSEDRSLFNYWKKDRASIHVNLAVLISNATPIFPRRMDSVSKSGSLSSKFFPPSIRRHRPRGFFSDGFMYLFPLRKDSSWAIYGRLYTTLLINVNYSCLLYP